MTPADPTRTTLTTATSMRVFAHPTGLRVLGLLHERGAQTAAQLGDVVDEAPGHGVRPPPAEPQRTDKRERWWQATTALTSWDTAQLLDDPDKAAASSVPQKSIGQAYAARYSDYVDALPALPREWVKAGTSGDRTSTLTVDELAAMNAELESLVARWENTSAAHGASDDAAGTDASGAEAVTVVYQAYRRL